MLNERLLGILSTKENVNLQTLGFEGQISIVILPSSHRWILRVSDWEHFLYIVMTSHMISTISFYASMERPLSGLEMMRSVNEENAEENRKIQT